MGHNDHIHICPWITRQYLDVFGPPIISGPQIQTPPRFVLRYKPALVRFAQNSVRDGGIHSRWRAWYRYWLV